MQIMESMKKEVDEMDMKFSQTEVLKLMDENMTLKDKLSKLDTV